MTILLLEHVHPEAEARLSGAARVLRAESPGAAFDIAEHEAVDAIVTRGRGQVPWVLIEACPALRVIARVGVGVDNIDVAAATERGVMVINSPGSTTTAVAEHTLLLMSALVRNLAPLTRSVRDGRWEDRRFYSGDELSGKRLGLVGLGEIGLRVAQLAAAYGMDVAYWSRQQKDVPYPYLALDALLSASDVVSLHVALTPETRHLLNAGALEKMKPGAYLVNTARGAVIDEDALLAMLQKGRLAGFAADVLADEPPHPADPLLRLENVLVTPHVGALTQTTFRNMSLRTAGNLLAALQGGEVEARCIVNR